jgi:hypothetical protein
MTQREAASAAKLTPQTWHLYDSGKVLPSEKKRRALVDAIALGKRRRDERASLLLLAFHFGGLRLLADPEGEPISFSTPEQANAICELLSEPPFDALTLDPLIVPAWRDWRGLPATVRELDADDDGEAVTAALITAGAIASMLRSAPGWVVE